MKKPAGGSGRLIPDTSGGTDMPTLRRGAWLYWIPAFAGMTEGWNDGREPVIPAKAGIQPPG